MPNEFTVVGEHKEDPLQLLVLGADGGYYGYRLAQESLHPVEPDEQTWVITIRAEAEDIDRPPSAEELRYAAP